MVRGAERGVMDNPYYDWSPLVARPPLRWPNDARVALCVIVSLEHLEWVPPSAAVVPPSAVYGGPYPNVFDSPDVSLHEYGNRVGVFRVMEALDECGIRATVAMDGTLTTLAPFLVRECLRRDWEFMGHGIAFSRMITERMAEEEEREHIRRSLAALDQATGVAAVGWVGADYGESTRTVRLLAESGVRYVCDWPNDEQPYRMTVPNGEMVGLPVAVELDEVFAHRGRFIPASRWAQMVIEAFDRLHEDGAASGRLLVLNLHPWIIGQPFRIKYLKQALSHIVRRTGVWTATGNEIVDWYLKNTAPESDLTGASASEREP